MRIRFTQQVNGHAEGDETEKSDATAELLIRAGVAERVNQPETEPTQGDPDHARPEEPHPGEQVETTDRHG
ncbi:MAG: hypothetical protein AAGE65_13715 [Planctomycetota bacterium]